MIRHIFKLNLVLKEPGSKRYLGRVNTSDLYACYQCLRARFFEKFRDIDSGIAKGYCLLVSIRHFLCNLHTATCEVTMSISVLFLARAEMTAFDMSCDLHASCQI